MVATVHIVAQEDIVGVWQIATNAEQFDQVVPLAVNVAHQGHRQVDRLHVLLLLQNLLRHVAQVLHILLNQWLQLE